MIDRYYLEEPLGVQKIYAGKTTPAKVVYLGDAEQNMWSREANSIKEL